MNTPEASKLPQPAPVRVQPAVRCECDWNGKRTMPEVVATHYENGRLVYERARCRACGGVAWELGKAQWNSATRRR